MVSIETFKPYIQRVRERVPRLRVQGRAFNFARERAAFVHPLARRLVNEVLCSRDNHKALLFKYFYNSLSQARDFSQTLRYCESQSLRLEF